MLIIIAQQQYDTFTIPGSRQCSCCAAFAYFMLSEFLPVPTEASPFFSRQTNSHTQTVGNICANTFTLSKCLLNSLGKCHQHMGDERFCFFFRVCILYEKFVMRVSDDTRHRRRDGNLIGVCDVQISCTPGSSAYTNTRAVCYIWCNFASWLLLKVSPCHFWLNVI